MVDGRDWVTCAQSKYCQREVIECYVYIGSPLISLNCMTLVEHYVNLECICVISIDNTVSSCSHGFIESSNVETCWKASVFLLHFPHVWVVCFPWQFFYCNNLHLFFKSEYFEFSHFDTIDRERHCLLKKKERKEKKHARFRSEEPVLKVWTAALLKGQCSALGLLTAFVFRFCSPNCSSYSALLFHFHHDQWERQKARAARPQKVGLETELKALTIFLQPAALSLAPSFSLSTPSCSLKSVQSPLGQAQAGQWISSHLRGGANWKRAGRRTSEERDPTVNEWGLKIKN